VARRHEDEDENEQAGKEAYSGLSVNPGNGAREAVAKLFDEKDVEMGTGCTCPQCSADYALAWLWRAGFKVVPVES